MKVEFEVPIRTRYTLNSRMHWAQRAKLRKMERDATKLALLVATRKKKYALVPFLCATGWNGPYAVTLTRLGPRCMDDDNIQGALKSVRDEIAAQLGLDDGDARLTWRYLQERGKYAVRVCIETREAEAA